MSRIGYLLIAIVCAAGCTQERDSPFATRERVEGLDVYLRAPVDPDAANVASQLAEHSGRFAERGPCLVVTVGGTDYTPVFTSRAEFEAVRQDLRRPGAPGEEATSWMFGGGVIDPSLHERLPAARPGCPSLYFSVAGPRIWSGPGVTPPAPAEPPPRPQLPESNRT